MIGTILLTLRAWTGQAYLCGMRNLLLALALCATTFPALAEDCHYWNAFNDDVVRFDEAETLVQTVKGGAVISCTLVDNRLARGPFPIECSNGETEWDATWSAFPDAEGNIGALLLYSDLIWYLDATNRPRLCHILA